MASCVRLITIHGRPLSLIDKDAFRDVIQIINLQKEKINSHKVRDALIEQAIEVRRGSKRQINTLEGGWSNLHGQIVSRY